jgi:hypothetical protein
MSNPGDKQAETQSAYEKARAVKLAYEDELMTKTNVVGVGVGLRQEGGESKRTVALVVMVTHKVPKAQLAPKDIIPSEIDGVPVDVQAVGTIKAQ